MRRQSGEAVRVGRKVLESLLGLVWVWVLETKAEINTC